MQKELKNCNSYEQYKIFLSLFKFWSLLHIYIEETVFKIFFNVFGGLVLGDVVFDLVCLFFC